jgi:hypothetical protein
MVEGKEREDSHGADSAKVPGERRSGSGEAVGGRGSGEPEPGQWGVGERVWRQTVSLFPDPFLAKIGSVGSTGH